MRRRKVGGRPRFRKNRPRKKKTFEDLLKPQPGEIYFNEDTGIMLYMEDNAPAYAFGELLELFYRRNEGLSPIVFKLEEDGSAAIAEKLWYAIMYGSWHIRIIQGRSTEGPHVTELWFKSQSMKKNFWVATLQLMGFYFNEDQMREALMLAIANREFFLSDTDRDSIITV